MKLNTHQSGMTLGSLFALMHLGWLLLLGLRMGQWSSNMMHNMHFMNDTHDIGMFGWEGAFLGLIGAFVSGYVIGYVFARLWNLFGNK
jgi:hypothetical protein